MAENPPSKSNDHTQMNEDILQILLEQNELTPEQAEQVRRRVRRAQISEQQALIDLGFSSQSKIYQALSQTTGIPFISLDNLQIPPDLIQKVPTKVALRYQFVPISMEHGTLTAAFANPPSVRDREALRLLLGLRINICLATPNEITNTLKKLFGLGAETVIELTKDKQKFLPDDEANTDQEVNVIEEDNSSDASIIQLVNEIIADAIHQHATDIHIEPFRDRIRLRYRIDGMLREIATPPGMHRLGDAIVSRIKIMARLNIAEKRLPHDGRIRTMLDNEATDLRVSIMPTRFGETICLRILTSSSIFIEMGSLGLSKYQLAILGKLVSIPHGIVLVTGPTGSGKTTTLYAALAYVRDKNPERKIITVENPVEYELPGTTQMQMHAEIGFTFASALRSILRHDPDSILVGEIRDNETADIAIQSALTGHLVLSTLHTNDSVGAVNRLINMGIEPYLLASALVGSIAQRLVRRLCNHCKVKDDTISPRVRAEIAKSLGIPESEVSAYKAVGCPECNKTGYRGRVAVYEFFLLNEEIQEMIEAHATTGELREKARLHGMKTLREDGWDKVRNNLTSIEEIERITANTQISYDIKENEE